MLPWCGWKASWNSCHPRWLSHYYWGWHDLSWFTSIYRYLYLQHYFSLSQLWLFKKVETKALKQRGAPIYGWPLEHPSRPSLAMGHDHWENKFHLEISHWLHLSTCSDPRIFENSWCQSVRLGSVFFTQTNVSARLYHVVPRYKKGNNWPRDNFTLKAGPGSVIWVLASQFKIVISGIY